jgi:hypothetical protein
MIDRVMDHGPVSKRPGSIWRSTRSQDWLKS